MCRSGSLPVRERSPIFQAEWLDLLQERRVKFSGASATSPRHERLYPARGGTTSPGRMLVIPGVEAGSTVKLGRCINVDSKEIGPDIFNPDTVKTRETNNIYFEYKQVHLNKQHRSLASGTNVQPLFFLIDKKGKNGQTILSSFSRVSIPCVATR